MADVPLYDILIRGGLLIDGSGAAGTRGDLAIEGSVAAAGSAPQVPPSLSAILPLDVVVRRYIHEVLAKTGGNKSQAARLLGITRKTLRERLERDSGAGLGR